MKQIYTLLTILVWVGVLIGCTSNHLNAPCPNFGETCTKIPVNSWNVYSTHN